MRSAFSAPRTTHIEISYAATGLFVLKSCRFAGTWSRPGVAMLLTGNVGVPSLRARRLLQMCKPLSKDTPHKVINSGACGSAAPGFCEPSREASRSFGFNPIAQQVSKNEALLSRSPGAVGPASRRRTRRRRYADIPAAALLTGLTAREWSPLALRPYASFFS